MFKHSYTLLILLLTCACSSTPPSQTPLTTSASSTAAPVATPAVTALTPGASPTPAMINGKDACSLLSSEDIQAVQGEPLKSTKRDDRAAGPFLVSTCYYELPTAVNSVSLSVTQNNGTKAGAVREYWEETFGKNEHKSEKERELEKKKARAPAGEEEEEGAQIEKVSGVGEEAFWSGSRVGGALFVLKNDRYLRISVGGKGDSEAKLKRSKILAAKVLRNF